MSELGTEPIEGEVVVDVDKFEIIGRVVKFVAGYGAGVIVSQVIKNNVVPKNPIQTVGVVVGGMMMAGLVAHHVGNYGQKYTDEFIDTCRTAAKQFSELQEQIRKVKEEIS